VSTTHEEAARAFLREFEGPRLDAAQIDRIVDRFAPDGVYHVFAWEEPHVGHDAIRAELRSQAPRMEDCGFDFLHAATIGDVVFIQRIDWVTMAGKRIGVHVVGVVEFDAEGRITSWRDYLDSREIATKLR
jgi:limonene-1,2-epoxide hydrolase